MKNVIKSRLTAGILITTAVCLGIVFASDVIVKEGLLESANFQSTGCAATGTKAVAFGYDTEASGDYCTAFGCQTTSIGTNAVAFGYDTEASGNCSTAMGEITTASGYHSIAMGYGTQAIGPVSTAMGYYTTASEDTSTAMGDSTTASGFRSTAMGCYTEASGTNSIAMGDNTEASGYDSTAMGFGTAASGDFSTAMGFLSFARGDYSTAIGYGVRAESANYTTAIGKSFTNDVQDSFAVGYGQKDFSVKNGDVHVYGKLTVDGDFDPKTLEIQLQERNSVIERYEKYVTPDKKSGVVYINSETKLIEVYYPYEGVIRNILGETIYNLPSIRINNDYETYYVFDTLAGQVVKKQRAIYDKYRIKEGIEFDSSTGQFIDQTTEEIIPKKEAIELYR